MFIIILYIKYILFPQTLICHSTLVSASAVLHLVVTNRKAAVTVQYSHQHTL